MGKGSDYLLYFQFLDNIIFFGWERGDGSIGAGVWGWEHFFWMIYFQNMFFML